MARPRFRFRMHPVVVVNQRVKGTRCRDCTRFLFPTVRWFHRDKNRPDGFQLYCKACKSERDRKSNERHREGRLASARAWKREHKDELKAWRHVYNAEYRRGTRRRTDLSAEPLHRSIDVKLCSSCGAVFALEEFRRGRRECQSCWNARQPEYRDPAKRAIHHQNRRSQQVGKVSLDEWRAVLARYGHRCAYCGAQGKLTMDPVEPLAKGGQHRSDNLVPACPSCNSRKHTQCWEPTHHNDQAT